MRDKAVKILLLLILTVTFIIIYLLISGNINKTEITGTNPLPVKITFNNKEYVMAKCIFEASDRIEKIGLTNGGIDVYDFSDQTNDKRIGVLLKKNDRWLQCYTPLNP